MALFGDYTQIDTTETQISCNWQCMDWNILFFIAKTKCNYYSKFNQDCETKGAKDTYHEYSNDYLDSDKIANIYFTSDVDAKDRVRGLNEHLTRSI